MKQGIRMKQKGKAVLFGMKDGKILVSGNGFSTRLSPDDFLELYAQEEFEIRHPDASIDEKKDEEYYQWRARKQ